MLITGLAGLFFYCAAFILLLSAALVVTVKNPVHAVLFLILCFVNASILFLLTGAEFLAMILLIIYVGAIAILFLFIVMMIDIDYIKVKKYSKNSLLLGFMVAIITFLELSFLFFQTSFPTNVVNSFSPLLDSELTNTEALGNILYTDYIFYFELVGLILLVAMISAISLTIQHKLVKRQSVSAQVNRTISDSIEIKKVETGKGLGEQ
ncbi:NADH-quinone oxidoreductase subunit J [Bartonella sp. DGB1]|uniref:NADH-quinone oxidoreductase subunit J n=1 Tax=Bartonella sp. DGB1 TaxID=3239807 RepID=UPI0035250BC8